MTSRGDWHLGHALYCEDMPEWIVSPTWSRSGRTCVQNMGAHMEYTTLGGFGR
jgi:hypothetical protein